MDVAWLATPALVCWPMWLMRRGLTRAFGEFLAGLRQRQAGHDPGRVAVDVAVMLADGGEAISDLAVLRDQAQLFGVVASDPTAWRLLSGVDSAVLLGCVWLARRRKNWRGHKRPRPAAGCRHRWRPASRLRGWCSTWTPPS